MDKTIQPQQLSFNFDGSAPPQKLVTDASAHVTSAQNREEEVQSSPALVYDFQLAMTRRQESTYASLYRQILDSVKHIG